MTSDDATPAENHLDVKEYPEDAARCSDAGRQALPADDHESLLREVDSVRNSPLMSSLNLPQQEMENYLRFYLRDGARLHLGTVASVMETGLQAETQRAADSQSPSERDRDAELPGVFWAGLQLTVEYDGGSSAVEIPLYGGGADVVQAQKERAPIDGLRLAGACVAIIVGDSVEWSMGSGILVAVADTFDTPARAASPGLDRSEGEDLPITLAEIAAMSGA